MERLKFGMVTWGLLLSMAGAAHAEGMGMGSQPFQGKIDQIDRAAKTITVDPGPLQMAKEFQVKDDSQLQSLKQGDEVNVEYSEQGEGPALAEKINVVEAGEERASANPPSGSANQPASQTGRQY